MGLVKQDHCSEHAGQFVLLSSCVINGLCDPLGKSFLLILPFRKLFDLWSHFLLMILSEPKKKCEEQFLLNCEYIS